MIRTQIYLPEQERSALRAIAHIGGVSQSELIREAIDEFIAAYQTSGCVEMLRAARGIWVHRADFDLRAIRAEFDRSLGGQEYGGAEACCRYRQVEQLPG